MNIGGFYEFTESGIAMIKNSEGIIIDSSVILPDGNKERHYVKNNGIYLPQSKCVCVSETTTRDDFPYIFTGTIEI